MSNHRSFQIKMRDNTGVSLIYTLHKSLTEREVILKEGVRVQLMSWNTIKRTAGPFDRL